jgi:hypothetical protein
MGYNLHPLSFAETLDRAFRVYRDHFLLLAGICATLWIPCGVMRAFGTTVHAMPAIATIVFLALFPVMSVAVTAAVANVYLDRPTTVSDAYGSILDILTPTIGTYLLFYLLLAVAFVALIIPGIYFANCWSLAVPVMIVEHRFGIAALRRSRHLVTGAWWRTLGIFMVAGLIAEVPAGVLQLFWSFIPFLGQILTAATSAVASGYSIVVLVIYYFDRRCRTEDFDLRLLAQQIRSETATAPAAAAPAPTP